MIFNYIFLQAPPGTGSINIIFLGAMIAILYFFIIRPQTKKQKEQNNFMNDLSEGDKVVTDSGIVGKISKIDKEVVVLDVGVGSKTSFKVMKSQISKDNTELLFSGDSK